MSYKNSKVHPTNDVDEIFKPAERRRKNSNGSVGSIGSIGSSPRIENGGRPSIAKMGKQSSFSGTNSNHRDRPSPRGGGNNHISPRPPLTRAKSYAEGESISRTRSNSNSVSLRGDPKTSSLRRNASFKMRKKRVTFRNPLTEYEPNWIFETDNTPGSGEVESSNGTMMLLDDDLKRRQEMRRKRRQDRFERSSYNINNVSCLGLMVDGCALMLPSCAIC